MGGLGKTLRIFEEKAQRSRKGASATEFVQVFFSLLLEFLPISDFFFCMFVLMFNIMFFGVDEEGHKIVCIGYLLVCLESVPDHPPTDPSLLNKI